MRPSFGLTTPLLIALALAGCDNDTQIKVVDDAPSVTIVRPSSGTVFNPDEAIELCLQLADEDELTELQITVESDIDGVLFNGPNDLTECEGGNAGLSLTLSDAEHTLTVTVTDTANQATQANVVVTAEPNELPLCAWISPEDGLTFFETDNITFEAQVSDAEMTNALLGVVVESDVDGLLFEGNPDGAGLVTFTQPLTAGGAAEALHNITLSVTDDRGATSTCLVSVNIDACLDDDGDGVTVCDGDCDDGDDSTYPDAVEVADGADNDCDGTIDEYTDLEDDDLDGFSDFEGDCDDANPDINPDAVEIWYDGVDSDCTETSDYDQDGDGVDSDAYGGQDCDDLDGAVNPLATETWYDGVDQDCDGKNDYDYDADGFESDAYGGNDCDDYDAAVNAGAADAWYDGVDANCDGANDYDADKDGYESSSYGGDDCDDTRAASNPGASETWYDGLDGDCDGSDDYDQDGDGFKSSSYGGSDCDDTDGAVNTAASETWYDGVDQNCDGKSDYDQDGDGADGLGVWRLRLRRQQQRD
ncbi:MAG: hypothetical protein IPI35_15950 [Deltaproteobacteria bacterium]|nr:hypothetical protein [Deltaproteobacteria bacterium]